MKLQSIALFAAVLVLAACGGAQYIATLSGANERPTPITTNGTGSVTAVLDGTTLDVSGQFSGLSGNATQAHVHGPADAGSTAGTVCNLTITPGADAGSGTLQAECPNFDVTGLNDGLYYVNVHTSLNMGGEIRGQLTKQ